jgi:hypothetical protein
MTICIIATIVHPKSTMIVSQLNCHSVFDWGVHFFSQRRLSPRPSDWALHDPLWWRFVLSYTFWVMLFLPPPGIRYNYLLGGSSTSRQARPGTGRGGGKQTSRRWHQVSSFTLSLPLASILWSERVVLISSVCTIEFYSYCVCRVEEFCRWRGIVW